MDQECAEKIIKVLLEADRNCEYCASDLLERFIAEFPEHKGLAFVSFENSFGKEHKLDLSKDEGIAVEKMESYERKDIEKSYLHGWDDGKIYYWKDKTVLCINDEPELFAKINGICEKYFEHQQRINPPPK